MYAPVQDPFDMNPPQQQRRQYGGYAAVQDPFEPMPRQGGGGFNPLDSLGEAIAPGYQMLKGRMAQGAQALGRGGAARVAGKGALGLLGKAARFAGPIGLAVTGVGGVLNAGSRMMKGENPVSAIGNAAYDTADYATLGLLKPAVGMIQNAAFGESSEDKINRLHAEVGAAQAANDYGTSMVKEQELAQEVQKLRGAGGSKSLAENQQDYTMGLANQRFGNELQQQQRMFDQQFANQNRVKESDFELQRRASNQALNNSYYADNWKNNQMMGRDNLQALNQLGTIGMQNMGQAMMMRY